MATVVAIHQPNFLPWLGWFDKLARADVFVLLDDVQFPRTGRGTWVNRVKLLVGGSAQWVTAPIVRSKGSVQEIREVTLDDGQPWREKTLRTIEHSYRRSPRFDEVFPLVEEALKASTDRLAELNEGAARGLARRIGLDESRFVRSSELGANSSSTELLIELTRAVGGDVYLAGGGAGGYQEDEKFAAAGIELRYQAFEHPAYAQAGADEFVPGLSIVDALMNCGYEATRGLLAA